MKFKKLLFVIALLIFGTQMQGQFLKKLQNKLKTATEDVNINKTTQDMTEKLDTTLGSAFDSISYSDNMNMDMSSTSMVPPSELPEAYDFEWVYTLQITDYYGDQTSYDYYLKPEVRHVGMLMKENTNKTLFFIMDVERNINVMLMSEKDNKIGMATTLPVSMTADTDEFPVGENFVEIEDKVINGVTCKGFKMEDEESITIMYNDMNAPVSLANIFSVNTKLAPKNFNPAWLDQVENSMMMEVTYIDKKTDRTMVIECINSEQMDNTFVLSDYNFMGSK